MEEIIDYTVTENCEKVILDKDKNGKAFKLKDVFVIVELYPLEDETTTYNVGLVLDPNYVQWGKQVCVICNAPIAGETRRTATAYIKEITEGMYVPILHTISLNRTTSTYMQIYPSSNEEFNLTEDLGVGGAEEISVIGLITFAKYITAGSRIRAWGIRK